LESLLMISSMKSLILNMTIRPATRTAMHILGQQPSYMRSSLRTIWPTWTSTN
jgi:hypothetical protein